MIQTQYGPVTLRRQRDGPLKLVPPGKTQEFEVKKGWLVGKPKRREWTMQAMAIAAVEMTKEDIAAGNSVDPVSGMARTIEQSQRESLLLNKKLEGMKSGKAPVQLKRLTSGAALATQKVGSRDLKKYPLTKLSTKRGFMGGMSHRYFNIDNGKLKEYKFANTPKVKHLYELHNEDCICTYEELGVTPESAYTEKFESGYKFRLRVRVVERPHGPVFLYAEDARQAKSWETAIKMSKYLQKPADRESLAFVVGRLAGSVMNKGWQALFDYAREIDNTKKLVKNFSMRLMRVEESRGWTKLRMVYLSVREAERRKVEGRDLAASFLRERMEKITTQSAKEPRQVRHTIVAQMQTRFRQYRQEKIFDRIYPLGSNVVTRMQQALSGVSMGACFESLGNKDVMQLTLDSQSFIQLVSRDGLTKKARYSEVQMPVGRMHLSVSESLTMLSFSEMDEGAENEHLAKEGWAHYVNLDQISSVVFHTERMMGKEGNRHELSPNMCSGAWFTINGPRVCWGRKIHSIVDRKTKEETRLLVGSHDGQAVGAALARGERMRMFRCVVALKGCNIFKPESDPDEITLDDEPGQDGGSRSTAWQTYMVLHILGRRFRTNTVAGNNPTYTGTFQAEVPISPAANEQTSSPLTLSALDESEVSIEVVQWDRNPQKHKTVWAGKMPLWKIFGPDETFASRSKNVTATMLGMEEEVVDDWTEDKSLSKTMSKSSGRAVKTIKMVFPGMSNNDAFMRQGSVEIEVSAGIRIAESNERRVISPELQGRGPITSLFSSHKTAWFDPTLDDRNFLVDQSANFIELSFGDLSFPETDRVVDRLLKYQIVAKLKGIQAVTSSLHRAKEAWKFVISAADTKKINFQDSKLYLPIPPGAWCSEAFPSGNPEERLHVEISVRRCLQDEAPALSLAELSKSNGKPGPSPQTWEHQYHARAYLDRLLDCDGFTRKMSMPLTKISMPPCKVLLGSGQTDTVHPTDAAYVSVEATIRDRDFVLMQKGKDRGQGCVLLVGDKAMLRVEEPLLYPKDEVEFRRRFIPGTFEAAQSRKQSQGGWVAPLRDPSLSHEYSASNLDKLEPPVPFKQKYLPTHSDDIIPYKYVLPQTELDFTQESRPGVYWRVVEQLAAQEVQKRGQNNNPPEKLAPAVVSELTHLTRQAPCVVLAVYANGTCDVELAQSFMTDWEKHKDKRYTIPGAVVIKEFKDTSTKALATAPIGAGDMTDAHRLRIILRDVPLSSVISVQSAGFSVYDAGFASVEDAIKVHPSDCGNDFNPRMADTEVDAGSRRGTYAVHAGPLPSDAGASCQYEWQLHLQAPSEAEMYHFVTCLRQSVRMNLFQEGMRLDQFARKAALARNKQGYSMGPISSTKSGQLEVVLVEMRHLRPPVVQKDVDVQRAAWGAVQPEKNCLVSFRLVNKRENGSEEELMYRGSKSQFSPQMAGDNPCWADMKENKTSGGWVFKTPQIDPTVQTNLELVLEVKNSGVGGQTRHGLVRVPVTTSDSLCDPNRPFRNMWRPLCEEKPVFDEKSGMQIVDDKGKVFETVPLKSGEMHIMTLWTPTTQTERAKRLPKSAKAWQMYELKSKLSQAVIREPVYDTQARKTYNPNIQREPRYPFPSTRYDTSSKHVERYEGFRKYLECTDDQSEVAWKQYMTNLQKQDLAVAAPPQEAPEDNAEPAPVQPPTDQGTLTLGARLLKWAGNPKQQDKFWELNEVIRRGVPAARRSDVWLQITRAQDEMNGTLHAGVFGTPPKGGASATQSFASATQSFANLVAVHQALRLDPFLQLHEDCVAAIAWEQSTIPGMVDMHLNRLKRAQDVCIALIGFSLDSVKEWKPGEPQVPHWKEKTSNYPPPGLPMGGQIAYCEGLLAVAFHLIVAMECDGKGKGMTYAGDDMELEHKARAFWILYSISCGSANKQFSDYYGRPGPPRDQRLNGDYGQIIDRLGPMDDVFRLGIILDRLEPELATTMNSLGFHLSTVFLGAFSRLFSFMMPLASLYRFWDLLFSDSWRQPLRQGDLEARLKPPRHSLIDLAFGALRHPDLKSQILSCYSAMEVKDCILAFFESLYDPADVIQMAVDAERDLWESMGANLVTPLHVKDYQRAIALWDGAEQPGHLFQFRRQNKVLADLTYSNNAVPEATAMNEPRLTTKNVIMQVVTMIKKVCAADGAELSTYAGMMRLVPQKIRELGPELDQTAMGKIWSWASRFTEGTMAVTPEDYSLVMALGLPPFPKGDGEPTHMDTNELAKIVSKAGLGKAWETNDLIAQIFEAFKSPWQKRMSLNEFFVALICCSKGTVGDKAMGLFQIYGHQAETQLDGIQHVTQESHSAHTIIDTIENGKSATPATQMLRPPEDQTQMAIHLKVYTATMGSTEDVIGDAYVPNLRPYFYSGTGSSDKFYKLPIWGQEMQVPPGMVIESANEAGFFRPQIGVMSMGIKWMTTKGGGRSEVGQLGLHLQSIQFEESGPGAIEAQQLKNPRVTVCMYDEKGEAKTIKRWDPRTGARKAAANVTMDVYGGGAFGGTIEFEHTMTRFPGTGALTKKRGINEPHGWDDANRMWVWARKWGNQESEKDLQVRKEHVRSMGPQQRNNTISLQACRHITKSILSRGLCTVTNRQAALISDQVFNRAGAVPGVIDALVVQYDRNYEAITSIQQLRTACESRNRTSLDVRQQLITAHENMVDLNRGDLTLFPSTRVDQNGPQPVANYNFSELKIQDPFPAEQKLLFVRYVRAGDGVRQMVKIPVEPDGSFRAMDLALDLDFDSKQGGVQMAISKHQFVTCILASPVLGEILRKLTTTDLRYKDSQNRPVAKEADCVRLEVLIADPTGEDEDDDLMDSLNVRQRVLLEVWDSDFGGAHSDFLGQCFLPSLGSLSDVPKSYVLPIENAPADDGGGQYSRPDSRKADFQDKAMTGNLFIEASWKLPAEDLPPRSEDVKEIVEYERKKHTGTLYIKIIKAEGVRSADAKSGMYRGVEGSDPYVRAFVQNECFKDEKEKVKGFDKWGWRCGQVNTKHDELFRTKVIKHTLNPTWNEPFTTTLQTGSFEKQDKQLGGGNFDVMSKRTNAANQTAHILSGGGRDLKIYFGNATDEKLKIAGTNKEEAQLGVTPGYRHKVTIQMNDSIHQFKKKIQLACRIESDILKEEGKQLDPEYRKLQKLAKKPDPNKQDRLKRIAMLDAVVNTMGSRHAVMVFSATAKLREMRAGGQDKTTAYKRQYQLEHADPSSWQPMDPSCSFHHYQSSGFGLGFTVQLRVCEGTSDYKVRNKRFRDFEEEQAKWSVRPEDLNTEMQCWGYAMYEHPDKSLEWRQALVERLEEGAAGSERRRYQATFVHAPLLMDKGEDASRLSSSQLAQQQKMVVDADQLLLGPPNPKVLASANLDHREFLARAKVLHNQGRNEAEIVTILNTELRKKWQLANEAEEKAGGTVQSEAPENIKLQDVRFALKDSEDAAAAGPASPGKGPQSALKAAMLRK